MWTVPTTPTTFFPPPSVVVLERCRNFGEKTAFPPKNPNKSLKPSSGSKFCSICGWDVSHRMDPTMTTSQFDTFVRDVFVPSCSSQISSSQLTKSLQQSKYICTICQDSLEQVEFLRVEMTKLENALKQVVDLLRLKVAKHSSPREPVESVVLDDINMDNQPGSVGFSGWPEEEDLEMDGEDVKRIIVEECDVNADVEEGRRPLVSESISQPRDDMDEENHPEQENNGQRVPEGGTHSSLSSPMIRRTRQSKLRPHKKEDETDDDDVSSSDSEEDEESSTKSGQSSSDESDAELNNSNKRKDAQNGSSFPCADCGKVYQTLLSMIQHRRRIHKTSARTYSIPRIVGPRFHCGICDKGYLSRHEMQKHVRNMHKITTGKEESLVCGDCQRQFTTLAGLISHKKKKHGEEAIGPLFHCSTCDKGFSQRTYLNSHMKKSHALQYKMDRQGPFRCDLCQKEFTTPAGLSLHKRTQHNAPPATLPRPKLLCDICAAYFCDNTALSQHKLRFHDKVYPFPCPECGWKFMRSTKLRDHVAKHHGAAADGSKEICEEGSDSL